MYAELRGAKPVKPHREKSDLGKGEINGCGNWLGQGCGSSRAPGNQPLVTLCL